MSNEAPPMASNAAATSMVAEQPTMTNTAQSSVAHQNQAAVGQCENCGFELDGPYCGRCGQPVQSMIRFFGSVVMQFLDDVFGFDSRAGRTLLPLVVRPGFLTNEYFAGRRVHFVPPVRLYLFVSIIFFILLGFFTDDSVKDLKNLNGPKQDSVSELSQGINAIQAKMAEKDYELQPQDKTKLERLVHQREEQRSKLQSSIGSMQAQIDEITERQKDPAYQANLGDDIQKQTLSEVISGLKMNLNEDPNLAQLTEIKQLQQALDEKQDLPGYQSNADDQAYAEKLKSLKTELLNGQSVDLTQVGIEITADTSGEDDADEDDKPANFSMSFRPQFDFLDDERNQHLMRYFDELEQKAKVAFEQDAAPLAKRVLEVLPKMMFFLLPIFALMLKFFYLFSKRYYMEHLTVALHSHTFVFVVLMMMAMFSSLHEYLMPDHQTLMNVIENTVVILGLWLPCYLLIMQKKVYKQGYFMTFIKFGLIGISYVLLIALSTVIAFFWGLNQL